MLATLARLTNGLFVSVADMADSKIDKLSKEHKKLVDDIARVLNTVQPRAS